MAGPLTIDQSTIHPLIQSPPVKYSKAFFRVSSHIGCLASDTCIRQTPPSLLPVPFTLFISAPPSPPPPQIYKHINSLFPSSPKHHQPPSPYISTINFNFRKPITSNHSQWRLSSMSCSVLVLIPPASNMTFRNAANYVSETVQGGASETSKEVNKNVAKDSQAPIDTRATAAKDALGDKFDQHKHEVSFMDIA